jgi:hypothetical protein
MNRLQRGILCAVVMSLLVLPWGCTAVPTPEFEAYKRACDEARGAAEKVLLDYAVAKQDFAKRQKSKNEEQGENQAGDRVFDIRAITHVEPLDAVDVRMHAWHVLSRYNEALIAVAAGHSQAEISSAVDGLTEALRQFPIGDVAALASEAVPYAQVAKVALGVIEREVAARHFVESVARVYPEINKFLDLSEADINNFYNVRMGLHDLDYDGVTDRINEQLVCFGDLCKDFNVPEVNGAGKPSLRDLIVQTNARLKKVPQWPPDGFLEVPKGGHAECSPLAYSQLLGFSREVENLIQALDPIDSQLVAYRDVLIQYVKVIQANRQALRELVRALERKRPPAAVAQDVFAVTISLRRAFAEYEKAR